jgi:hypothetical protein
MVALYHVVVSGLRIGRPLKSLLHDTLLPSQMNDRSRFQLSGLSIVLFFTCSRRDPNPLVCVLCLPLSQLPRARVNEELEIGSRGLWSRG